ncbi:MAG TPA: hypothetical protein PLL20_04045 [Phycisphaerae bacterium]|nr:hypothetical protein [Phycisphaerae bacterium]HRR86003.1 hypothetical protein [Phycisphaerae bacterium]
MSTSPAKRVGIGRSFVAGCCAGIPAGVILAYLAPMPFYLGLFFFLVLGLVIGAIMFRFGRGAVPVRPLTLNLIGSAVVLLTWSTTLVTEYATLPRLVARRTETSMFRRLTPQQKAEVAAKSRQHVMSRLLGRPFDEGLGDWLAGFPKYLRWIAQDGTMECPRVVDPTTFTFKAGQSKASWVFRVVVSMALLAFAVLSQYLLLARTTKDQPSIDAIPSK